MWGRAGRRGRGLAVYVAGEDALDQFFCRHPDEFLGRPVEAAILDHESEQIHAAHLLCAAHEGPLSPGDGGRARARLAGARRAARERRAAGRAARRVPAAPRRRTTRRRACRCAPPRPTSSRWSTSCVGRDDRDAGGGARVLDRARRRGLPAPRAARTRSSSSTWWSGARCCAVRRRLVHAAQARDEDRDRAAGRAARGDGRAALVRQRRRDRGRDRLPAQGARRPPADRLPRARPAGDRVHARRRSGTSWTSATLGPDAAFGIERLLGALHAAEHAQIAVLPLLAMCDRWDIGGLSTNAHPQTGRPTIFIYDGHPGGVGITRAGLPRLRAARRRRAPPDRRVQLQARLPVVRAVAEVRQPQRAAVEGGREGADGEDAGGLSASRHRRARRSSRWRIRWPKLRKERLRRSCAGASGAEAGRDGSILRATSSSQLSGSRRRCCRAVRRWRRIPAARPRRALWR